MKKNLKLVSAEKVEYVTCDNVDPKEVEEIINIYKPQMEGILNAEKGYKIKEITQIVNLYVWKEEMWSR